MPSFSLTDDLGKQVDNVKVDFTSASSLFKYLRSQLLHLIVVPDYLALRDKPLMEAAPQPIQFQVKVGNTFELGGLKPEIDITPEAQAVLRVNTTEDSNLFGDDPFRTAATVPADTGYVGLSLSGALDLGVGTTTGDLTFGFEDKQKITIGFWKAFPLDAGGPGLGSATGRMISSFVIPGDVADLAQLQVHDICEVAGEGRLKVSGSFTVTLLANPLAAVNLPLNAGKLSIQDGAVAGVSASLALAGSYRIRLRRLSAGSIELSYLKDREVTLRTDLTASAGVSAKFGDTDLITTVLGAISKDTLDPNLLSGLTAGEIDTFTAAVKEGVDHSLRASLDLALSKTTDDEAVFQYEIQPELLDAAATVAVHRALEGDLSLLTALEAGMADGGVLAPGVKLLNSVLSSMRAQAISLHVNLLGIVNLISLSKLIERCEILTEPASGDVTIKETVSSERISAITNPLNRQEALRKAMFDSVMVTTTYRAANAVSMTGMSSHNLHFAVNQNTNAQTLSDYLNWFVALDLMHSSEKPGIVSQFHSGGPSTCLMRTGMDDAACQALFFDPAGNLRAESEYIEIGRRALQALLDPDASDIDRLRYAFLDDANTWRQALDIGPAPGLGKLIGLPSTDARFNVVLADVTGDLYDIVWWASAMSRAGEELLKMRAFLAGRDPIALADDHAFAQRRDKLQNVMAIVVKQSKVRFHEPFGMVCLFRASGSRQVSGKLAAGKLTIDRPWPFEVGVTAGG
jgi:hypothetical protein